MQIHPCRRFVDFVSDAWRLLRTHACSEEGSSLGPSPKHFIALDPQNNLPTILREQFFNFFEFILTNFVVWPSRAQNIPFCWYSCLLFWLQGQSLADEVEMEKQVNDPLRVWYEALNDEDPPLPQMLHIWFYHIWFFWPPNHSSSKPIKYTSCTPTIHRWISTWLRAMRAPDSILPSQRGMNGGVIFLDRDDFFLPFWLASSSLYRDRRMI